MALYQYFKPSDTLPDPSKLLSASVSERIGPCACTEIPCQQQKPDVLVDVVPSHLVKLARGHGNAQEYTKIKIRKFLQKAL